MIDYLNTHAETIILLVAVVLGIFSVLVFLGAVYSRWVLNLTEKKKQKIRAELSDLVIRYISRDLKFNELKSHLSTKTDYAILLNLSNKLEKTLEGEEEKRLKRILGLKPIKDFFTSRFKSSNPLERAKACLYFSKQNLIEPSYLPIILEYTNTEHPMLAYAATLAIINHGTHKQKRSAIHNLLVNKGLSNQALNDIFAEFQRNSTDDRKAESDLLIQLIDNRWYSSERTALMIRTLGELGFFESAGFLLQEYQELPSKNYDAFITHALIDVLASFGMAEILERMHSDFTHSLYSEVREACAKAMGLFTDPASIPFLKWLLVDEDFYVRFHAAKSLSNYPDIDLKKLSVPNIPKEEYEELLGEVEATKEREY